MLLHNKKVRHRFQLCCPAICSLHYTELGLKHLCLISVDGIEKNGCMKPCLIHAWSYTCSMRMQMHDDELRFWQDAWGLGPIGATCGALVVVANWQKAMCLSSCMRMGCHISLVAQLKNASIWLIWHAANVVEIFCDHKSDILAEDPQQQFGAGQLDAYVLTRGKQDNALQ